MKLGFRNRLAVVAPVLVVAIVPLVVMALAHDDVSELVWVKSKMCMTSAQNGPGDQLMAAKVACFDQMSADNQRASDDVYNWSTWAQLVVGTLVMCGIFYGLVWAASAAARWVGRGRQGNA
jgi:hypothetical protein